MERTIIVGGGHGGAQAAVSLRQEGYEGEIVLVSDEAHLPYHKPPLSKTFLKAGGAAQLLRPESFYTDNAVELKLETRVAEIDRRAGLVRCDDGAAIEFSSLILATGASARRPPIAGADLENVFVLRNMSDAERMRAVADDASEIVIIGGGFIGLELAHTLVGLGKQVKVVEMGQRLLARSVAPVISAYVLDRLFAADIDVRLGAEVRGLEQAGARAAAVTLAGRERLGADMVVLGTGAVPSTGLAEAAGLAVDNGIVVDHAMRTADPRIFALGDVASFTHWQWQKPARLECVQNANDQARHAAKAITGKETDYRDVSWFWSDQGSTKLQMAGLSMASDRAILSGSPENDDLAVYHFDGDRLVCVETVNRPGEHMLARRLLAAGITPSEADIADGKDALKALLGGPAQGRSA